jgi:hypothetical protein
MFTTTQLQLDTLTTTISFWNGSVMTYGDGSGTGGFDAV